MHFAFKPLAIILLMLFADATEIDLVTCQFTDISPHYTIAIHAHLRFQLSPLFTIWAYGRETDSGSSGWAQTLWLIVGSVSRLSLNTSILSVVSVCQKSILINWMRVVLQQWMNIAKLGTSNIWPPACWNVVTNYKYEIFLRKRADARNL
jgi:hypothetical protein